MARLTNQEGLLHQHTSGVRPPRSPHENMGTVSPYAALRVPGARLSRYLGETGCQVSISSPTPCGILSPIGHRSVTSLRTCIGPPTDMWSWADWHRICGVGIASSTAVSKLWGAGT